MLCRPRKSSLRARSLSDMLNVLLNAAIVSIGGRPSRSQIYFRCLFTSLPPRSSYRSFRRRTRARATLVPNEMYERAIPPAPLCSSGGPPIIGIRVFKSLFYQGGTAEKIIYLVGRRWHSYAKTFAGRPLWTILAESTFRNGIRSFLD